MCVCVCLFRGGAYFVSVKCFRRNKQRQIERKKSKQAVIQHEKREEKEKSAVGMGTKSTILIAQNRIYWYILIHFIHIELLNWIWNRQKRYDTFAYEEWNVLWIEFSVLHWAVCTSNNKAFHHSLRCVSMIYFILEIFNCKLRSKRNLILIILNLFTGKNCKILRTLCCVGPSPIFMA